MKNFLIIIFLKQIQSEKLIWNAIYRTGQPDLDKPHHFALKNTSFS